MRDKSSGTTAPSGRLHVVSSAVATYPLSATASTGNASFRVYENGANEINLYMRDSANNDDVKISASENSYFNGGNVGIGTTAPDKALEVAGEIKASGAFTGYQWEETDATLPQGLWRFSASGNKLYLQENTAAGGDFSSTNQNFVLASGGNIGIGGSNPADKLDVAGDIRVGTGTTGCVKDADGTSIAGTCSSDERLKTDIIDLPDILDNLVELRPVSYHWNETAADLFSYGTSSEQIGLIAQEVEIHLPSLVTEDAGGYKQIRFSDLPIYLLKGMREMWTMVTGIINRVDTLEARIEQLESQLATSGAASVSADNDNSPAPVPTIQLRGNDPAQVALNATYSDLGVIAKDANGNDISVSLLLDGEPVDAISLDTSTSSTHIITYSAEVSQDAAVKITRTVIIGELEEVAAEDAGTAETETDEAEEATDEPETTEDTSDAGEENVNTQDADQENVQQPEETMDEPISTTGENEPGDGVTAES